MRRREAPPQWWQLPWREIVLLAVGSTMLLSQVIVREPQPLIVGAGLALLGVPGVGSVQRAVRRKLEDGDTP